MEDQVSGELLRSTFMRSEGSLLFNVVGTALVVDAFKIEGFSSFAARYHHEPGEIAGKIGKGFVSFVAENFDYNQWCDELDPALNKQLERYTFEGRKNRFRTASPMPMILGEVLQTSVHFPINIIKAGNKQCLEENRAPLYENFDDFVSILRAPWFFKNICKPAANTANSFWGSFSVKDSEPGADFLIPKLEPSVRLFDIYNADEARVSTYGLSAQILDMLRKWKKTVNNQAALNKDNNYGGASSGCPAMHRPELPSDAVLETNPAKKIRYDRVLQNLDARLVQDVINSGETAIKVGLTCLASMLERTYEKSAQYRQEARA